ncbi:MAG: hypothetical protein H6708_30755 [Kofleriaceae bacterium]|nr:hypothetical protein [Kofleriaceae bacterium]
MSAIDPLVAALGRAREARDWSARAREVVRVERVVDGPARTITRTELAARVHVDAPTGRGSADLVVAAARPLPLLIDEAIGRAEASIGPGWRAPPPGAPGAGDDRRPVARRS